MDAIEKLEAIRAKAANHRQATWSRIKRDAPAVAELLNEISQTFGKPEAVRVVIQGDVVLDKGELLPSRRRR